MSFKDVLGQVLSDKEECNQYAAQIARIKSEGLQTNCISEAVTGVLKKLPGSPTNALVVYGDPQSGKTEMMICLTAALLDQGCKTIVHLMNDSVDLLKQNMDRFRISKLSPSPRLATDLVNSSLPAGSRAIIFCKKTQRI